MSHADPRRSEAALRLDELYRAHAEFAWRTVRYLGVRAADAEDVVHEVFVIVQRRLPDYDGRAFERASERASERAWIGGIARNVVLHHHRKTARTERKHLAAAPVLQAEPDLDEGVSRAEAAQVLQSFLDDLDHARREVFVLGELEGLTAPEIAHVVGSNVNTVYSRLRSARLSFTRVVERLGAVRRREGG